MADRRVGFIEIKTKVMIFFLGNVYMPSIIRRILEIDKILYINLKITAMSGKKFG